MDDRRRGRRPVTAVQTGRCNPASEQGSGPTTTDPRRVTHVPVGLPGEGGVAFLRETGPAAGLQADQERVLSSHVLYLSSLRASLSAP